MFASTSKLTNLVIKPNSVVDLVYNNIFIFLGYKWRILVKKKNNDYDNGEINGCYDKKMPH